jgi:hypothetical protein
MNERARRTGVVTLVGVLFLIGAGFNLIWGLAAVGVSLGGSDTSVLGDLSRGDLEGLGIAGLVLGSLQLYAGLGVLNRSSTARLVGLVLAVIVVLLNFAYHRVLEGWAFTSLAVNLAIIMILTAREEEFV